MRRKFIENLKRDLSRKHMGGHPETTKLFHLIRSADRIVNDH